MVHWRPSAGTRSALLLLIAALIPILLLAAGGAYFAIHTKQSELEAQAVANARILSRSVDRELQSQLDQVEALAASPALDPPADLGFFREVAWRERLRHPHWLAAILLDPAGRWIVHTETDPTGRRVVDTASLRRALTSRRAVVGEMRRGERGAWGLPIRAPVIRGGEVAYVATVVTRPDDFRSLIQDIRLPADWIITIVNEDGQVVARSRGESQFIGRPTSPANLSARTAGPGGGVYPGPTLEGISTLSAYWLSPKTGWSVHIGIPRAGFEQPLRVMLALLVTGLVLSLAMTALFIWLLLRGLAARNMQAAAVEQTVRMDALGRLTGGVAHDFNNMLMIIQGNADTLARRLADHDAARRPLAAIRQATDRAAKLVRQLQTFARGAPTEMQVVDLNAAVAAMRLAMEQAGGLSVGVSLRLSEQKLRVRLDALQLEAALINLCTNARDAMPEGGAIVVSLETSGDAAQLEVRDSGLGFAAEVAPRVFEPFFTTKPSGTATGLGLTQVYSFMRSLGGSVAVSTAAAGGGVVTLRFPIAPPEAPQEQGEPAASQAAEEARILVVEDDENIRATTGAYLRESGLEVQEARDADEALRVLRRERFDAVISDIVMPGSMSGAALAGAIRRSWPSLPVLLVSGYSDSADEARRLGIAVVPKPYELSELERIIRAMAAGHAAPARYMAI